MERKRIFISYSHHDTIPVRRIVRDLEENATTVWQDVKNILPGDSVIRSIEGALRDCDVFIIVLSRNSVDSAWVQREYHGALSLQGADEQSKPKIIPALIESCQLPVFLLDILYADFTRTYEHGFKSLSNAMGITTPSIPSLTIRTEVAELVKRALVALGQFVMLPKETQDNYENLCHEISRLGKPLEADLMYQTMLEADLKHAAPVERQIWRIFSSDSPPEPTNGWEALGSCRGYLLHHFMAVLVEIGHLARRFDVPPVFPPSLHEFESIPESVAVELKKNWPNIALE